MKKTILISLSTLALATSCVDSLTDYNIDPKNPANVTGPSLFAGAERSLTRLVVSTNVNDNPFRLWVQYWAETTYLDETRYNIKSRQIDRQLWDGYYAILRNLVEAKNLVPNNKFVAAKVQANQQACIEILSVYTWATLVNTFGDVPYTEALDFNKSQPKYDDAKTIYNSLFTRLDAAIATLDPKEEGMGAQDAIYNGDVAQWIKFGNSLKLRLALTIADDDAAKAKTLAEQASKDVFESLSDQAQLIFVASPPNTNPLFEDLVQSGRHDFVGTNFFINDNLLKLKDPRVGAYFRIPNNPNFPTYRGGVNGAGNNFNNFSEPGAALLNPALPGVLLSYPEVEFLLAEAVSRGFAVGGGSVEDHYNAGVTASISQWGGTEAQAQAYLDQPTVAFTTASGTNDLEKIGFQKWIALYDQPVTAWTEWRRLDTPKLTPARGALSVIPLRVTYPTTESNLNKANYNAASALIGGDAVSNRIFWDKK
ncbi:SusD/RagB family nutrient-binding outer membrane lipoprotein [Hymenobacter cellulosivorans]|uniref:SusD/RagB family nutrient-binding outer membrane lipoprotein n=1 Tax=Hymenobacter cellulosivorans TaxID=2932249 RepID=A0ABY4F872_9BACT|nr:SusD/RagB family nutrient-binding outer membrane lipoprotein [Hymenobacter cellulosivorans]UOQ52855.1 SusD/RagB family nutrient-binding outer membrane lipoprotein [Hymenobacter cellulosivorans]